MATRRRTFAVSSAVLAMGMVTSVGLVSTSVAAASTPNMSLLSGATAPIPAGDTVIGAAPSSTNLSLEVALAPRDPAALAAEVNAVSTPGSPQYRQFLAPGQFAQLYGPTPQVISAVSSALEGQGLSVGPVTETGLAIPVTGTVAQVEAAFDTPIADVHELSGKIGYFNQRAPSISASIASYVQGIVGLDTLVQPQAMNSGPIEALQPADEHSVARPNDDTPALAAGQPTPTSSCGSSFTQLENYDGSHVASQFAQSYNLDPLYAMGAYGSGTTVAIAEYGGANYVPSDISTFANCYGISSYQLTEEGDTSLGTGINSDETELDIETVLSLAPSASIEVYQAGNTYDGNGYYALFNKIVGDDSAKIVSVSYGTCEAEEPASWMSEENTVLQAAALNGQTFFASSGDTGSEACNGGGPNGVETGDDPVAQVVDSSNGTLYVANESDDNVSVFDENSEDLVATVPTGSAPDAIVFDSATSQVFVANSGSNSLTDFSATTCQASNVSGCSSTSTITGSQISKPSSLFISGQTLYIGNAGDSTVTANSLSGAHDGTAQLETNAYPSAIAVDSAGEVYVTDSVGQQLYYFDDCSSVTVSGCTTVGHLNMGDDPNSLLFDPSNGNLYVGNVFDSSSLASGGIGVVDTSTNAETQYIGTGGIGTSSLAMSPSGDLLVGSIHQLDKYEHWRLSRCGIPSDG
jgi:YVTN family beta-propeller protein